MSWDRFQSGERWLAEAAYSWLRQRYGVSAVKVFDEISPKIPWRPSLHLKANSYTLVAAEVSEERPYPDILAQRMNEIVRFQAPVSVYCVCPAEEFLKRSRQGEVGNLKRDGIGLLTVDRDGSVTRQHQCIPLVQHIPEREFLDAVHPIPKRNVRVQLQDAYDTYLTDPVSGNRAAADILEELINDAARKAARKQIISNNSARKRIAELLDDMYWCEEFKHSRPGIAAARSYVAEYRNTFSHAPKSSKQAYKKYNRCKDGFKACISAIDQFLRSMKNAGINPTVN